MGLQGHGSVITANKWHEYDDYDNTSSSLLKIRLINGRVTSRDSGVSHGVNGRGSCF